MQKKWTLIFAVLALMLILSACAESGDAPAQTVEIYHKALVEKDQERLISMACADWESQALLELDSFVSVETELVDMSCQTINEEGDLAHVTCEGVIAASYEGEVREFPLSGRTFIVQRESGEWRLCGYE